MRGPLPWCNWAVPGLVLAGAFPCSLDDKDTNSTLSTLLELGINSFVCLQAELCLDSPESEWRAGRALRYAPTVTSLTLVHFAHVPSTGRHGVQKSHCSVSRCCACRSYVIVESVHVRDAFLK
jgi:hypothetical protein